MVVIRLARGGAKKRPFYHMVAADSRRARASRYIERLGYYNPLAKGQEKRLHLDSERVQHWLGQGAQPSDRVAFLWKEYNKLGAEVASQPKAHKPKPVKAPKVEAPAEDTTEVEAKAEEAPAKAEVKADDAPAEEAKAEDKAE